MSSKVNSESVHNPVKIQIRRGMVLPKILYKEQFGLARAPAAKRANSLTDHQIAPYRNAEHQSAKEDYLKRPVKFTFEPQLKPSFSQLITSPPKKVQVGASIVPPSNFLITFNTGNRSTDQTDSSDSRAELRAVGSPQPRRQSRKHQRPDVFSSLDCLEVNPFYPEAMEGEVFRTVNHLKTGKSSKGDLTKVIEVGLPRLSSHFPKPAEATHKQYRSNLRKAFVNQQYSFNSEMIMGIQNRRLNSLNLSDFPGQHSTIVVNNIHCEQPRILQQRTPMVALRPEKASADWAVPVGPVSQNHPHPSERRERLLPVFRLKHAEQFSRWSGRHTGRRLPGLESRSCDDAGDPLPQPT